MKIKIICCLFLWIVIARGVNGQTILPNLQNVELLTKAPRSVQPHDEQGKKGVCLTGQGGVSVLTFKDIQFSKVTITFDAKGVNKAGSSFLGMAFHIENDSTYEAIYFRPFNFLNPDTIRRSRAVQYIAHPTHPWHRLRAEFPGKFENKVTPVPNPEEWFKVKIVVNEKDIVVFVGGPSTPSLVVAKLTTVSIGKIGLWVDGDAEACFANVEITKED